MPEQRQFTRNPFGKDPSDPYFVSRLGTNELAAYLAEKLDKIADRLASELVLVQPSNISGIDSQGTEFTLATDPKGEIKWELIQASWTLDTVPEVSNDTALLLFQENLTGGSRNVGWLSSSQAPGIYYAQHLYSFGDKYPMSFNAAGAMWYHGPAYGLFDPGNTHLVFKGPGTAVSAISIGLLFRKVKLY